MGERQDGDRVPGRRLADGAPGPLADGVELSGRGETCRRVDEYDGRLAGQRGGLPGEVRPREGAREQRHGGDAQRQQQQLPQVAVARLLDRRGAQVAHRRKLHDRLGAPVEQMDRNRDRGGGGPQEEQRREEREAEHQRARPRVER